MQLEHQNGKFIEVRRSTFEKVLLGVLSFLTSAVCIWVATTLTSHERRLSALETNQATTHTLCESVNRNMTTINNRLGNIENILMRERRGSTDNGGAPKQETR
jgi:hypothetical protein